MQLTFRLNKTADFIFDHLTDTEKFVSAHPLISKMDKTGNNTYLIHETVSFGFLPISFTYPATIDKNRQDMTVLMRATVMKLTEIEIKIALIADANGTLVEEQIQIRTPLPINAIIEGIFRKQHAQLFKNIELKAV